MTGTTALQYQMMIEGEYLRAMINAEMRSAFSIACQYGRVYAKFIGCKDIPNKPLRVSTADATHAAWINYYFDLLELIGIQVTNNLTAIRAKYKEKNSDLPSMNEARTN